MSSPSLNIFWALSLWLAALPAAASAGATWLGEAPRQPVERVVSLAPSITEIVLDLGLAERLVGVSRHDDAPEVAGLRRVGGFVDPSAEAVLALAPDLLIAQPSPGNRSAVQRIAALGVPVLVLPLGTIEDVRKGIVAVAESLGVGEKGRERVAKLDADLAAIRERVAGRPRVSALIVYGWQPLVVGGPGSYADELLEIAGGVNAAASARGPFPILPLESALALRAQHVLDATGSHGGAPPALPGARKLESDAFLRPGPRLAEAARELAALLHPEAKSPAKGDGT